MESSHEDEAWYGLQKPGRQYEYVAYASQAGATVWVTIGSLGSQNVTSFSFSIGPSLAREALEEFYAKDGPFERLVNHLEANFEGLEKAPLLRREFAEDEARHRVDEFGAADRYIRSYRELYPRHTALIHMADEAGQKFTSKESLLAQVALHLIREDILAIDTMEYGVAEAHLKQYFSRFQDHRERPPRDHSADVMRVVSENWQVSQKRTSFDVYCRDVYSKIRRGQYRPDAREEKFKKVSLDDPRKEKTEENGRRGGPASVQGHDRPPKDPERKRQDRETPNYGDYLSPENVHELLKRKNLPISRSLLYKWLKRGYFGLKQPRHRYRSAPYSVRPSRVAYYVIPKEHLLIAEYLARGVIQENEEKEQGRRRVENMKTLAEKLDISERTVRRNVDKLKARGYSFEEALGKLYKYGKRDSGRKRDSDKC